MSERSFSSSLTSIRDARRFVAAELTDVPDDVRERARLLASELCTNALVHGGSGFTLCVTRTVETAYIGVTDPSDAEPRIAHPTEHEVHGRGLQLVADLADRWGVERVTSGSGKTVWLEIDISGGAAATRDTTAADDRSPSHRGESSG